MKDLCFNVLLQLGSSVPLQAFSTIATCLHEFERAHHSLQSKGVTCLSNSTSVNIWTFPPQIRMQKKISDQLQSLRRAAALRALPTGPPNTGGALLEGLSR